MPSALASKGATRHDALDNYNVDDFSDDPFGTPTPPGSPSSKKRKEPDSGLGIDEEVEIQKRARPKAVKLDEARLLSDAGIPKLRSRAKDLKIKGKGHEFSDATRLLTFYQLWLDDLFPKAKFLDALTMVEKAGHKRQVIEARNKWIDEGKPRGQHHNDDDDDLERLDTQPQKNDDDGARLKTPERAAGDGVPDDDDDLYGATPRRVPAAAAGALPPGDDDEGPEEDDLDALMAEAEGVDAPASARAAGTLAAEGVQGGREEGGIDEDEEAAMREMEGW